MFIRRVWSSCKVKLYPIRSSYNRNKNVYSDVVRGTGDKITPERQKNFVLLGLIIVETGNEDLSSSFGEICRTLSQTETSKISDKECSRVVW